MSIGQIMGISRESMNNNQYALTVVSHNIANINNSAYSKQRAEFCESVLPNYSSMVSHLNGAYIGSIVSYSNQALNNSYMDANTDANYYNTLNNIIKQMEGVANEMGDAGLQKTISDFFTAAHNLNNYPTDINARENYTQATKNVLSKFQSISTSLDNLTENLVGDYTLPYSMQGSQLGLSLESVNQKLEQVANLNLQIAQSSGNASGLIDQRNKILDEVSSFLPVKVSTNPNGTASVAVGGVNLVEGTKVIGKLSVAAGDASEPAKVQLTDKDGNVIVDNINSALEGGGTVGAMLKMVSQANDDFMSIPAMQSMLDSLANDFAEAVNAMQTYSNGDMKACCLYTDPATGELLLMEATEPMFTGGPPFTAKSLEINPNILADKNLIATARVDTSTTDWEKQVGNSDNILAIAELRNEKIIKSPGSPVADMTIDKYITNLTGKVALQGSDLAGKADAAKSVLSDVATERASAVGVNMDEELSDMIKYQRAYEASARVFNAANEILQILVNLGR